MKIYNNILENIGGTPMVKINNLLKNKKIGVYAKIEGENPGGSIKDRIALKMIETAEKNGSLKKGKTIIEATSGNTGIGLAMIGLIKKYPC
jgi:S-sulfo-L-cysteine synthase (O-acetyl-L-serine-dependent)